MHTESAQLIAIGGLSGSGKSTLAKALAEKIPNTLLLRSDIVRKAMFGVSATTRLPPEAYTPDATRRLVIEMHKQVQAGLAEGKTVITDALFDSESDRKKQEDLAKTAGAGFTGFWLEAAPATLIARVSARTNDASDARAEIVKQQLELSTGVIGWFKIDANAAPDAILAQALTRL